MQSEDAIRAMRQSLFEDAARRSRELGGRVPAVQQVEEVARLAGMAAALNWVLGEDERPDWDFLDAVADPPPDR